MDNENHDESKECLKRIEGKVEDLQKVISSIRSIETEDEHIAELTRIMDEDARRKLLREMLSGAKYHLVKARAALLQNPEAAWASLFMHCVHLNDEGFAMIAECIDINKPIPSALEDAFVPLCYEDKASLIKAISKGSRVVYPAYRDELDDMPL